MLEEDFIEESYSSWLSPAVLVTKKDGSFPFCIDYRKIKNITKKDRFSLSRIDETLYVLSASEWISSLDLKSGYWQVSRHAEDIEETAEIGLHQFIVMPFGLCNALAIFERFTELVLRRLTRMTYLVYLDDIIVIGRNFNEHLPSLKEVFTSLKKAHLQLNTKKCVLFQQQDSFLEYIIRQKMLRQIPIRLQHWWRGCQ